MGGMIFDKLTIYMFCINLTKYSAESQSPWFYVHDVLDKLIGRHYSNLCSNFHK